MGFGQQEKENLIGVGTAIGVEILFFLFGYALDGADAGAWAALTGLPTAIIAGILAPNITRGSTQSRVLHTVR